MQLISTVSKYLIWAVLSCSLLFVWNNNITEFTELSSYDQSFTAKTSADSIWYTMSRDFKLDHKVQSSRVQKEIRKLLADQDHLYQILRAAAPYIYFIHQQTQARGLPAELALIPFVESEFNPYDKSNKGASGLWQLMTGTANELGVKVKSGYDGRRNVVDSTRAALLYFKDLGVYFNGDWYLAMAAYNSGQGKVKSAMRRAGSQSYWNLGLPVETKLYVPRLLAIAAIVKNPKKYGVELPTINNKPYFTELKVKKSVNLNHVAQSSGINIKTLQTLNPDSNRENKILSPVKKKDGTSTLLVPIEKAPVIKAKLQQTNVLAT